jgi:hypothetical protein
MGYKMNPGSKEKNTPGTFSEKTTDTISKSDFGKNVKRFQQMVQKDNQISSSYKEKMINKADSIVKTFNSSPKPRHVNEVIANINKNRLKKVQETSAYKALSKNPAISETGVGQTVKYYENKIQSGKHPTQYQIPTTKEIDKIISFGEKAANSKDINEAIRSNPFTAVGAYMQMNKARKDYASMDSIAKKQLKRIK